MEFRSLLTLMVATATVSASALGLPLDRDRSTEQGSTFLMTNSVEPGEADHVVAWGRPDDEVLVGDWNGDGIDTVALRRGDTFIVSNSHTGHDAFTIKFGRASDQVFAGDWNGDGYDTFAIRRGNNVVLQNNLSSNKGTILRFGDESDEMLVGDWDGDGIDTLAIRRGNEFHVANSMNGGRADHAFRFGRASDEVIIADWDGSGSDSIGLRRGNTIIVASGLTDGGTSGVISYGRASDEVYLGDWDGDGRETIMIRRTTSIAPTVARSRQDEAMVAPERYRANTSTRPPDELSFSVGQSEVVGQGWGANSTNTTSFSRSPIVSGIDPHGDEIQFVGYYDSQANLVIASKNVTQDGPWKRTITQYSGNVEDGHNSISLGIDRSGYLHVAWGMHGAPMQYAVTTEPWGRSLTKLRTMTGKNEERVTYPQFFTTSTGDMLMLYRSGTSGDGNVVLNRYDSSTGHWKQVHSNLIDGRGDGMSAYWQATLDSQDRLHISWSWRTSPDVTTNHNMYYAVSAPGGKTWRTSSGEKYSLPITAENAERIQSIKPGRELMNQTDMAVDEQDRPYIVSWWRPKNEPVQYMLLYLTDMGWQTQNMGLRSSDFSLARPGSKLRTMARPKILVTGSGQSARVHLVVRDIDVTESAAALVTYDPATKDHATVPLTDEAMSFYEPIYDDNKWRRDRSLDLLVMRTGGEPVAERRYPAQNVYVQRVPRDVLEANPFHTPPDPTRRPPVLARLSLHATID